MHEKLEALLARIPDDQVQAAQGFLSLYGPRLLELTEEDLWTMIRRLMAGDYTVVADLVSSLDNDAFIASVKANTARWANVEQYNAVRDSLRNEMILRMVPIVGSVLAAMVGL